MLLINIVFFSIIDLLIIGPESVSIPNNDSSEIIGILSNGFLSKKKNVYMYVFLYSDVFIVHRQPY